MHILLQLEAVFILFPSQDLKVAEIIAPGKCDLKVEAPNSFDIVLIKSSVCLTWFLIYCFAKFPFQK